MVLLAVATACAGTFFGASIYINLVEHPARMLCGQELAVREFGPSYARASVMQATLAVLGCLIGLTAAWFLRDTTTAIAAGALGFVVPFTLIVIFPTNRQLLAPNLDARSDNAGVLLARWNRLHAVRSALSGIAFSAPQRKRLPVADVHRPNNGRRSPAAADPRVGEYSHPEHQPAAPYRQDAAPHHQVVEAHRQHRATRRQHHRTSHQPSTTVLSTGQSNTNDLRVTA